MNDLSFENVQRVVNLSHRYFTCIVPDCRDLTSILEPFELCHKHFQEWELAEAEADLERAQNRLEQLTQNSICKLSVDNEMTESIRE